MYSLISNTFMVFGLLAYTLVAEQAIKDVVEPFMEEHPEFVW